jgi:hypothetical protein
MHKESTADPLISPDSRFKTTPATIIAIVVLTASGVAAWTLARADAATNTRDIQAIDIRVEKLEAAQTDIAVMKNDVRWIRVMIEREQQQKAR